MNPPHFREAGESGKNFKHRTREASSKVCYVESGKPLSLSEISKKNDFPNVLKVNEGQASLSHSFSFGSDQGLIRMGPVTIPLGVDRMFVALEKKLVEVATCKDLASKRTYTVPIKSSGIEVVPLHSTEWQGKGEAIELRQFLDIRSLPKVARAMKDFVTTKGTAVHAGELLFPQEVKKRKKDLKKRILVAKVEDGSTVELTLGGDSGLCGTFSIDSSDVRINLSLAAQCCKLPFACTMQPCNDEASLPFRVNVERVDKSEVISGIMKVTEGPIQDDIYNCEHVYEVPVNLDLKVTLMKPKVAINTRPASSFEMLPHGESTSGYIEMIRRTASVSSAETKSKPVPSKVPRFLASCKQLLYKSNECPDHNTHIKDCEEQKTSISSAVSDVAISNPITADHEKMSDVHANQPLYIADCNDSEYLYMEGEEHEYSSLDEGENDYCSVHGEEHPYSSVDYEEHQYSSVEEEAEYEYTCGYREHLDEYTYMSAESDQDLSDDDYTVVRMRGRGNVPDGKCDEEVRDCISERTALKSLDVTGVLHLLDAMNLGMYKESFKAAMIDGTVFSGLTNDRLSQLGVKLSLHRLRLLNVAMGVKTVEDILSESQMDHSRSQEDHNIIQVANHDNVDKPSNPTLRKQTTDGEECDRKECEQQRDIRNEPPSADEVDITVNVSEEYINIYDVPNHAEYLRPLVRENIVSPEFKSEADTKSRIGAQWVSDSEIYIPRTKSQAKPHSKAHGHGASIVAKPGKGFSSSELEIYKRLR